MAKEYAIEKAYDNREFLHGHSARPLRVLAEFIEPEERLAKHGISNTIVFFGSAVSVDTQTLEKQTLDEAVDPDKAMTVSKAHDACVELARRVTVWSQQIEDPAKRFHVCSGGRAGYDGSRQQGCSGGRGKVHWL